MFHASRKAGWSYIYLEYLDGQGQRVSSCSVARYTLPWRRAFCGLLLQSIKS
uniref:Uncharacterized protein n=1 Tax=Triticum urartu TaxID=4572 RepID=A0A8R7UJK9_TRIUA